MPAPVLSSEARALLARLTPISSAAIARARAFGDPETDHGAMAQGLPLPAEMAALGANRFHVWIELKIAACTWLISAPDASPDDRHRARITRADTLALTGAGDTDRIDRAIADYSAALVDDPDNRNLRHGRVRLLSVRKFHDLALADHDELVRLNPDQPLWRAMRARTHLDMGEVEAALRDYDEAIRIADQTRNRDWHRIALRARAEIHDERGDRKSAIHDLETILLIDPQDIAARQLLDNLHRGGRM